MNRRPDSRWLVLVALAAGGVLLSPGLSATPGVAAQDGWPWQDAAKALAQGPWPLAGLVPAVAPDRVPASAFAGTLVLGGPGTSRILVHRDDFQLAGNPAFRLDELPEIELTVASDGRHVVPQRRGPLPTGHPYWEFMPEPGLAWREPGQGAVTRVAMPFSLKEGNQNCLHNGLLSLRIGADGSVRDAAWQVASETCAYLKFDGWGVVPARLERHPVAEGPRMLAEFAAEREARLPVQPLEVLQERHPNLDLDALAPPAAADATVYGVVLDGVHYRSACPTRAGPHPFCELVALPSYSTAKSVFAGLVFLHMVRRWPELESMTVPELVPECGLPDERWHGVRLRHLADMSTGNYASAEFHADEASPVMQGFFLATTHADKLRFSCETWPHQSPPGDQAVYHSTDHYLLGVALQRFLDRQPGESSSPPVSTAVSPRDIHRDILGEEILGSLDPGPLVGVTQRTYDAEAQPFVSHGLFFHPDDAARIGVALQDDRFLASLLRPEDLQGLRFRDRSGMQAWALSRGEGYYAGFWGFDIAPHAGCDRPAWVPFMSGYGGIRWALPPGGAVYYFFTDGGHGSWMDAIIELDKVSDVCSAATAGGSRQ